MPVSFDLEPGSKDVDVDEKSNDSTDEAAATAATSSSTRPHLQRAVTFRDILEENEKQWNPLSLVKTPSKLVRSSSWVKKKHSLQLPLSFRVIRFIMFLFAFTGVALAAVGLNHFLQ
jgi:hypothetical protein